MPSPTSHGCSCGECHWCLWDKDQIAAIKLFLQLSKEKYDRLELHFEATRSFYQADILRGASKEIKDCIRWIDQMQVRDQQAKGNKDAQGS